MTIERKQATRIRRHVRDALKQEHPNIIVIVRKPDGWYREVAVTDLPGAAFEMQKLAHGMVWHGAGAEEHNK